MEDGPERLSAIPLVGPITWRECYCSWAKGVPSTDRPARGVNKKVCMYEMLCPAGSDPDLGLLASQDVDGAPTCWLE